MDRFKLHDLLKLDSIYGVLGFTDRITIHRALCREEYRNLNHRITRFIHFMEHINWEAPRLFFGQDRLHYFEDENGTALVNTYPDKYPMITLGVKKLVFQLKEEKKQLKRLNNP